jgi:hypothetical protein
MTVKKVLTWAFGAFVIFFLAFRPASAAIIIKWLGGALGALANGMGDFVSRLVS